MEAPRRRIAAVSVLLVLCACQATFVFMRLLVPRGDPGWDAAHHSMLGLVVYADIVHHRWISFLFDTYRQVYWPFLHSWFLAASMMAFGPTLVASRAVSLMAYAVSAILIGLLGYRLTPERSILSAAVAVFLWLTAAGFVNEFAVEALIESLAIAMTLASLLALELALEGKSGRRFAWAGLWAMATYFTKTDYGILVMAATLVAMGASAWRQRLPEDFRRIRLYLTPIESCRSRGSPTYRKFQPRSAALTNFPYGPPRWSVPGVLYHFRELMRWSDSPWIFIALAVCFVWSWRSASSPVIRVLLAYISIALVLHTISQTKDPKHIVKLVPLLFLLAGFQVDRAWCAVRRGKFRAFAPWALATLLLVAGVARLHVFFESARSTEQLGTEEITAAICERIEVRPSALLVGQFAEISPYAITWKLASRSGDVSLPFDGRREAFTRGLARLRQRHPWISLLERSGADPRSRVAYAPTKQREVLEPTVLLDSLIGADAPDRVVVLEVESNSAWNTTDYHRFAYPGSEFLPLLTKRPGYRQSETTTFSSKGIKMFVFDRNSEQVDQLLPNTSGQRLQRTAVKKRG